jgi:hypothetical protein
MTCLDLGLKLQRYLTADGWHVMFVWQDPETSDIGGFCGMLSEGKGDVAQLDLFVVAEK